MKMDAASPAEEAVLFVNAVTRATRTPLDNVRIVVFEISEQIRPARPFVAALDQVKQAERNPAFIRNMKTIDVAPLLTPADFYVLDDHMNSGGHEKVASALAAVLRN
jgi:hypothetical protein